MNLMNEFSWFFSFSEDFYALCSEVIFNLSLWRTFRCFGAERWRSRWFGFKIVVPSNMRVKPIFNFIFWSIIQELRNPAPFCTNFIIKRYNLTILLLCKRLPVDIRVQLVLPPLSYLLPCSILHMFRQHGPTFPILLDKMDQILILPFRPLFPLFVGLKSSPSLWALGSSSPGEIRSNLFPVFTIVLLVLLFKSCKFAYSSDCSSSLPLF